MSELSLEIIQQWLKDPNWRVRKAANNACQGRDIPLEIIQQWSKDPNWRVRKAAMNACQGRDVPLEIIQQGLKDPDFYVRKAAINACQEMGIEIPPYRTINPPKRVYKKCVGDVIVVASIPKDAEVRGTKGGKCRANKAKIVDIIGEVGGRKVGISKWDRKTEYFIGDEVEIDNFDRSDEECSTGFHFFCTKQLAESYQI